jgi:hypothetical protein
MKYELQEDQRVLVYILFTLETERQLDSGLHFISLRK